MNNNLFITNNNNKISVKLTTNTTESLTMSYKYQAYSDGVPSGSAITKTVSPTTVDGKKVFTIYLNQYNVGDELKEFKVYGSSNSVNLWDTHEGITVLLNGEETEVMPVYNNSIETETIDGETVNKEVSELHRNKFALNFDEDGEYTLQAIYKGNNSTEMSATDEYTFHILQPQSSGGGGSTPVTGVYRLEFVNPNIKTLTYDDKKSIQFRLTRGGSPVSQKTVEKVAPNGSIYSQDTNTSGIVTLVNNGYDAGKYKIGAYFKDSNDDDDDGIITVSTYKDVTIEKATPVLWHTPSPVNLGSKLHILLRDSHNQKMNNEKLIIYVNGSPKTSNTSTDGVYLSFKKKGTYKIKVVYNGNKNHKAITDSFNFKVN